MRTADRENLEKAKRHDLARLEDRELRAFSAKEDVFDGKTGRRAESANFYRQIYRQKVLLGADSKR